ncbi:Transcriptional regulatory protein ASH1 [Pichia kudriavzevii]|uniref:Transcriptional regulatory protein ASH1 n=1 Tax=Pichia kudriavzevii TaxID=4909 RepID=A0A1V2LRL9_PICKU|nr:Transcriptional regulatory protein ASH1 [Pichia kudriavzevii]
MPTTVTHIPRTCSPSPTLSLERKRKLDGDLLTTPVRPNSEDNALVTPPRSTKRSKTTPSSPIRDHHLYETPKTPSQKQQFNINLNARSPNYNYAITNPHNYSSVSLNSNGTTEVTPPQSQEVSPRLDTIQLAQPSVTPLRGRYYGEFMYSYPDTCYPFNINSSAIGRSDGNLRAATWRSACNEKIRHEFNKSAKEYAALSEKYKKDTEELKKQGSLNLPSIYDTKIFPSFNSINDTVNRGLNYFSYNASSRFSTDAQQEARSLLELRNASRDKPASTNHSTKTCIPVSVQSTPLPRLASRDDHNLTPLLATPEAQPTPQISTRTTEEIQRHSFLPHTHLPRMHTTQQLDDVNVSVTPMKAQLSCSHHFHENINKSIGDDDKIPGKNLQSAYRLSKVCMSCHSNQSPCWRPSWSPDEGQLCNSCGLRYRKTKARCYNPKCLKIPSKSEWALMMKRGKVLLDVYHEDGSVAGKQLSYRCLDCDSAMEVLR